MTSDHKLKEDDLKKCALCDCLIVSDSSATSHGICKCKRPNGFNNKNQNKTIYKGSNVRVNVCPREDLEESGIVIRPNCQSSVKIIVQAQSCTECDEEESLSKERSGSSDSCNKLVSNDLTMKHVCFRFCRKKKKNKSVDAHRTVDGKDDGNQTSEVTVKSSDKNKSTSETDVKGYYKTCCNCEKCTKSGGSCNTNTIIFPRPHTKGYGDGAGANILEEIIRNEAKSNNRNLEDILNELGKQRREIREIRDILDTIMRILREQTFMNCRIQGKNGIPECLDTFDKKNNLERKSNTLSINGKPSDNKTDDNATKNNSNVKFEETEPQKKPKKKKRLCPWCK